DVLEVLGRKDTYSVPRAGAPTASGGTSNADTAVVYSPVTVRIFCVQPATPVIILVSRRNLRDGSAYGVAGAMFIFPQSCLEYALVADESRASFTDHPRGLLNATSDRCLRRPPARQRAAGCPGAGAVLSTAGLSRRSAGRAGRRRSICRPAGRLSRRAAA